MNESQRYQQYLLEKELAAWIRAVSAEDRPKVIKEAYSRLYREAHWHSGVNASAEDRHKDVIQKEQSFGWALGRDLDLLEIGCGTGEFLVSASKKQRSCTGVEISELKADQFPTAQNLAFNLMEGVRLPGLQDSSFDVVLTSQVLEHFHPDDVPLHLAEVYRVLRPGGRYVIDTPSGLNGPHDISKGFDSIATGMHLKEWTYSELVPVIRRAGFVKIAVQVLPARVLRRWPGLARFGVWPAQWKIFGEWLVNRMPTEWLKEQLISKLVLYSILVIATKR